MQARRKPRDIGSQIDHVFNSIKTSKLPSIIQELPPSETKDGFTVRAADITEVVNVPREITLNIEEPEARYSRNPPPAGLHAPVQNTEIGTLR
ncbi:unnamed protein product [Allacma fusca]|uniref:Uncharacterized protein n=1 Tax=Allacma fusca TaxID=39272 RepID=A0A8J2LH90_9HEXA|nr:unnamed protein product [Allacma fusca]